MSIGGGCRGCGGWRGRQNPPRGALCATQRGEGEEHPGDGPPPPGQQAERGRGATPAPAREGEDWSEAQRSAPPAEGGCHPAEPAHRRPAGGRTSSGDLQDRFHRRAYSPTAGPRTSPRARRGEPAERSEAEECRVSLDVGEGAGIIVRVRVEGLPPQVLSKSVKRTDCQCVAAGGVTCHLRKGADRLELGHVEGRVLV